MADHHNTVRGTLQVGDCIRRAEEAFINRRLGASAMSIGHAAITRAPGSTTSNEHASAVLYAE